MPSVDAKPPSPSILRRPGFWITLLTVVPLLIGSAYVIENWLGARELARVKAEVAAAGIELDPHRIPSPRPPDAENFFATPLLLALGNGVTSGAESRSWAALARYLYSTSSGMGELRSPGHPEPTDWANIRDGMARASRSLGLLKGGPDPLRELAALLDRDFSPVTTDLEAALPRPQSVIVPTVLDQLRSGQKPNAISLSGDWWSLSILVNFRAHTDLATGRHDRAVKGIRILLRLAEGAETYRDLWSSQTGEQVRWQALNTTWTAAISPGEVTRAEWMELAAAHRAGGSLDRVLGILRSHLRFRHQWARTLRDDRKELCVVVSPDHGDPPAGRLEEWFYEALPAGWVDLNTAGLLEAHWLLLHRLSDPGNRERFNGQKNQDWARDHLPSRFGLSHALFAVGDFFFASRQITKLARNVILSRLAEIACTLEAFHADHQTYPAELTALVPEFLPSVPVDIDGQPVRYALDPGNGRYRVWSIGEDGIDGGGVARSWDEKLRRKPHPWSGSMGETGDWVWQYPPK